MTGSNEIDDGLPRYADLPVVAGTDLRHAWDVFDSSVLGTLNHLTPERRLAAMQCVRRGISVPLCLPMHLPGVPPFGRDSLRHSVYAANGFSYGDRISSLDSQSSTQWDGLLHVRHQSGFFGGRDGDPADFDELGIDRWARVGIVGRGVLLEMESYLSDRGAYDPLNRCAITPDDLESVAHQQGVEITPGDVLCVRFGWPRAQADRAESGSPLDMKRPPTAGLSAGADMSAYLWDRRIAAIVSDNPTVEVQPGDPSVGFLHHRLLTMLGMPLGELFDLDPLATECRTANQWDFLFTAVPWMLTGGVASPGNAVAIV